MNDNREGAETEKWESHVIDLAREIVRGFLRKDNTWLRTHGDAFSTLVRETVERINESLARLQQPKEQGLEEKGGCRFYIDCEFDGHSGPLLSMAVVADDGRSIYIRTNATANDPWVQQNILPIMDAHAAPWTLHVPLHSVGSRLRTFIGECEAPIIVADSPVDIGRFCTALSTSETGEWASADYRRMTFEVQNVDCYPTTLPGAVQHNAWWDAMALRHKLRSAKSANVPSVPEEPKSDSAPGVSSPTSSPSCEKCASCAGIHGTHAHWCHKFRKPEPAVTAEPVHIPPYTKENCPVCTIREGASRNRNSRAQKQ